MVVACGCDIEAVPVAEKKVPTPEIFTLTPEPNVSVTLHVKVIVWFPPMRTEVGAAKNALMMGAGQLEAVTVACAVAAAPHPEVAVNV